MFIPKRCPHCRDIAGWTEVYNPHCHSSIESFINFIKGYSTRDYVYRCENCGYEGVYNDHAETLDRNFRRRL